MSDKILEGFYFIIYTFKFCLVCLQWTYVKYKSSFLESRLSKDVLRGPLSVISLIILLSGDMQTSHG